MILIEDILQLHRLSIEKFGEKSAAIMESIIINHPFVDGNKRTGYLAMFLILKSSNYKLIATEDDAYSFTIKVSIGETKFDEIVAWLKNNTAAL